MNPQLHTTGSAARELGISLGAVLYYERIGLIHPARDAVGRRLLTPSDIEAIRIRRERRETA